MKTITSLTIMLLMVFMFSLTATVALAYDSDCEGPQYRNMAEEQPNK